jgi:ribose 5-phosphate isomerase B
MKKLILACDHGGYQLKLAAITHLTEGGYDITDLGCDGSPVDYPDLAHALCDRILAEDAETGQKHTGVLFCGTGIGMSMAANRHPGIRAAVCSDSFSAEFTRRHNDANVLCLGGRVVGEGLALQLIDIFLQTPFDGDRHIARINKI